MRRTKRQRQEIRNKEFCKKFLTSDWDGCEANEYFANKADPSPTDKYHSKPKGEPFDSLREIVLAENQVYSSIASLAFEKDEIVAFLQGLSFNNVFVPENIDDKERFRNTFIATAKEILSKINRGVYPFQKPKQ